MGARSLLITTLYCLAAVGSTAFAWEEGLTFKPFSAEYVFTVKDAPGAPMPPVKVAATGKSLRVDFGTHSSIVQLRPKNALVLTLMHGDKTYTTKSVPYDSEDLGALLFMIVPPGGYSSVCKEEGMTCRKDGEEKVGGRTAERWVISEAGEGDGTNWIDPALGIVLKSLSAEGDGMATRNVTTAKPSDALFELPPGYRKSGADR